jgi:purine-binding chemotaxis protein CheW
MGRMADARKRAKQKAGGDDHGPEPPKTDDTAAAAPAPEAHAEETPSTFPAEEPGTPSFATPRWVSSEETLTFPSEPFAGAGPPAVEHSEPLVTPRIESPSVPPPPSPGRIELPSSGLASDILGREDTLGVDEVSTLSVPLAPVDSEMAPTTPTVSRMQSSVLFGPQGRDERKAAPELMEHLVTFYLADEEYALDVRTVQEIIRMSETTHVPRAPQFIKGVINLRGRIIPVVDLKRKLELGEVAPSRLARIVVVKIRERLIGLLVDGASQVLKIPVSAIDAAPEEITDVSTTFIRGVAKMEKRLIILLDLYKILSMELEHAQAQ